MPTTASVTSRRRSCCDTAKGTGPHDPKCPGRPSLGGVLDQWGIGPVQRVDILHEIKGKVPEGELRRVAREMRVDPAAVVSREA